jgi:aryl-alcohol dehydrogenase-like predicted oxidoreductase
VRYRSMGPTGAIVSTISLNLEPDAARPCASDWTAFVYAALEQGICAFEVGDSDPAVIDGLAEAMSVVERRLAFVSWRIGAADGARDLSPVGLVNQARAAIARTGLERLDALMIEQPRAEELSPETLEALAELKASAAVRLLGVEGEGDGLDRAIATGAFDILAMPFDLTSGWADRNRIRSAVARDMAVVGRRPYRSEFHAQVQAEARAAKAARNRHPLAGMGTYGFLDATPGWTAEEICVAYALTESSLSSVQVTAVNAEHLERLAGVAEREMPPGLPAQIEMARFAMPRAG